MIRLFVRHPVSDFSQWKQALVRGSGKLSIIEMNPLSRSHHRRSIQSEASTSMPSLAIGLETGLNTRQAYAAEET